VKDKEEDTRPTLSALSGLSAYSPVSGAVVEDDTMVPAMTIGGQEHAGSRRRCVPRLATFPAQKKAQILQPSL
jgi:hypothetical protein